MGKFDRKKMRDQLLKRTQESYDRKEGDVSTKYFNADSDIPFWKCSITKDEPHIIDILPFKAGGNFPQVDKRNPIKKGEDVYVLESFVHTNVGPGKLMVVCPAKNYDQPCPICEEIDRRIDDGQEWEEYRDIAAKRRCAYNIVCYDSQKEETKGVQVWEVSHRYSEKAIQAIAKSPRGGGIIAFAHPDKEVGKSLSFEVANDEYRTITGLKLIDRDYDIPDELLEDTISLDEHLNVMDYDAIKNIFFRKQKESSDEDPVPTRGRGRKEQTQDEDPPSTRGKKDDINDDVVFKEPVTECPHDGDFGVDNDQLKSCDNCDVFEECKQAAIEIEAKKKTEKKDPIRRRR